MKVIDINVDVGEGFAFDDELLQIATSANVCCGAHAGSVDLTMATVAKCITAGVRVGAHPGVPDRAGMGRTPLRTMSNEERDVLLSSLVDQLLVAEWDYVKPHGALYNGSSIPGPVADVVASLMSQRSEPLLGMPGTHHEEIARIAGVRLIREGFADRAYDSDGMLVARSRSGAVLSSHDEIAAQVLRLAVLVDSICIHGDTPGCVTIAEHVLRTLSDAGYEVRA